MPASAADAVTVNHNSISTFLINGKPTFINGPRNLPKNPPNCIVLYSSVFDNFILRPKTKILLFPEMRVTIKIFTRAANLFFLNQFN